MNSNFMSNWLSPMIVATLSLLSGIIAYLTTKQRQKRGREPSPTYVSAAAVQPPLNGYAAILRDTLDRVEWLRQENEDLHRRLAECEQRHRAAAPRRSTPRARAAPRRAT